MESFSNSSSFDSPSSSSLSSLGDGHAKIVTPTKTVDISDTRSPLHNNYLYYDSRPNPNARHRTKQPIKPALKNGKIRSLSSPSKDKCGDTTAHYSFTTTSSASFYRERPSYKKDDYDEAWRKDGKELRRKLIEEDNAAGGSEFVIDTQSKLRNYCSIVDRVQEQFQAIYEEGQKLEEAYIMGNRLIKFLSEVLPTHQQYYSKHPEFTKLRIQTQNNLLKVRTQMDDISYALDREVYETVMKMQGLEFEPSPGKKYNEEVAKRKKKVTFAIEEKEETEITSNYTDNSGPKCPTSTGFGSGTTNEVPSHLSSDEFDLSLWENRDPGIEIVDLSMSSCDNSIDFDDLKTSFETSTKCPQISKINKHQDTGVSEFLNDDGWESFDEKSSSQFEWPALDSFPHDFDEFSTELKQDIPPEKVTTAVEIQSSDFESSRSTSDELEQDDDFNESSIFNSFDNNSDHRKDTSIEDNMPFVRKIARENNYCGINELHDEDEDSDAVDSWEQDKEITEGMVGKISLNNSCCRTMSLSIENSSSYDSNTTEEMNENISHEEFPTNFSEDIVFDEYSDDCSEEENYDLSAKNMAEMDFSDEAGADKTVVTAATTETEAMTADFSDSSHSKSDDQNEPIIGISRRDEYYPSFDSPQRDYHETLPKQLDYLEHKVKDLRVKNENKDKASKIGFLDISDDSLTSNDVCDGCSSSRTKQLHQPPDTFSYPIQLASSKGNPSDCRNESSFASVEASGNDYLSFSSESPSKPHPTAARLRNLKKTAAWKRRFGSNRQ